MISLRLHLTRWDPIDFARQTWDDPNASFADKVMAVVLGASMHGGCGMAKVEMAEMWAAQGLAKGEARPCPGELHGNSKLSSKPQHGYEIYDTSTNDAAKTGVSGQPLNQNGTSPRANRQVTQFNREGGNYGARVVKNADTRGDILKWERQNAERLRQEGNTMDKHKRP